MAYLKDRSFTIIYLTLFFLIWILVWVAIFNAKFAGIENGSQFVSNRGKFNKMPNVKRLLEWLLSSSEKFVTEEWQNDRKPMSRSLLSFFSSSQEYESNDHVYDSEDYHYSDNDGKKSKEGLFDYFPEMSSSQEEIDLENEIPRYRKNRNKLRKMKRRRNRNRTRAPGYIKWKQSRIRVTTQHPSYGNEQFYHNLYNYQNQYQHQGGHNYQHQGGHNYQHQSYYQQQNQQFKSVISTEMPAQYNRQHYHSDIRKHYQSEHAYQEQPATKKFSSFSDIAESQWTYPPRSPPPYNRQYNNFAEKEQVVDTRSNYTEYTQNIYTIAPFPTEQQTTVNSGQYFDEWIKKKGMLLNKTLHSHSTTKVSADKVTFRLWQGYRPQAYFVRTYPPATTPSTQETTPTQLTEDLTVRPESMAMMEKLNEVYKRIKDMETQVGSNQ